ncbi:MAG: ankyrin repeat domain-containing protein, partial [Nitrososphaera sp.]|nr:ankyrin repeat domain-containing protein [Nitrososphaera sp.]
MQILFPPDKTQITIPLERGQTALFVKALVNGTKSGYLLIDTGAWRSVLLKERIADMDVERMHSTSTLEDTEGSVEINLLKLDSIDLGGLVFANTIVAEQARNRPILDERVIGVLGTDVLEICPFTLDYQTPAITFYERKHFKPPEGAQSEERIFPGSGIIVRGKLNDQFAGWFFLDTGSTDLVLSAHFVRQHPDLTAGIKQTTVLRAAATGKRVPVVKGKLKSFEILGRTFASQRTLFSKGNVPDQGHTPTLGDVGGNVLQHFRLTFDLKNNRLWREYVGSDAFGTWATPHSDPNRRDFIGCTPLMHAAEEGRMRDVEVLLRANADVNATSRMGLTALMFAANNNPSITRRLIEKGANVNAKDSGGWTPLMFAASEGFGESVK